MNASSRKYISIKIAGLILISAFFLVLSNLKPADALYSSNLLRNNDFETLNTGTLMPSNWTFVNLDPKLDTVSKLYRRFNNMSMHISGNPALKKAAYQRLNIQGPAGHVIEFSGWIKTSGSLNPNGHVGLDIGIHYTDGTWKWVLKDAPTDPQKFDFMEIEARADKPYDYVLIYNLFYNQPSGSHAWFDGLRVNRNPSFNRLVFRVSEKDLESYEYQTMNTNVVLQPYLASKPEELVKTWIHAVPNDQKIMFSLADKGVGYESDATHYMWIKGSDGYYRFNYSLAAEMIDKYDSNNQIAYWYLYDEPIYGTVTNAELMNAYNFIKARSNKSIGVSYSEGSDFAKLGYGNNHSDFVLFSFYPYKNGQYVYGTDTTDHCKIERDWREMAMGTKSTRPWYGIVQGFGKEGTAYFEPTADQIALQAREYKSLGAGGIAYFSFSSDNGFSDSYLHILNRDDWRSSIADVNYEWLINDPL